MNTKMNFFKVEVPANLHFSAGVREFIVEYARFNNFPHSEVNKLRLVIDELFMNAVRYGSGENSRVVLELTFEQNKLKGFIEDFGEGKQKTTVEDLKKIIEKQRNNNIIMKTSGRGLAQIVSKWTDKMEIQNNKEGGIKILFEKKIEPEKQVITEQTEEKKNLVLTKKKGRKEHLFIFEGEINEENLEENKKMVNDFIESHSDHFDFILDFEKLHYCNSTFIGQIADWYNKVQKNGGRVIIRNPSKDILEIIDMVGLTKVIPIEKNN